MAEATRLAYPCDFPIKVLGQTQPGFAQAVVDVVLRHAPGFDASNVGIRASRGGKYLSVTCVIEARSREQIDALYRELCDHPMVAMVL